MHQYKAAASKGPFLPSRVVPFDSILDRVTGNDPSVTDYILEQPARCPHCGWAINEKTLVEVKENAEGHSRPFE